MTYQAIYKCRLCGKEYVSYSTGKEIAVRDARLALCCPDAVPMTPMQTVHSCDDGSFSIADFQGFKAVEE